MKYALYYAILITGLVAIYTILALYAYSLSKSVINYSTLIELKNTLVTYDNLTKEFNKLIEITYTFPRPIRIKICDFNCIEIEGFKIYVNKNVIGLDNVYCSKLTILINKSHLVISSCS